MLYALSLDCLATVLTAIYLLISSYCSLSFLIYSYLSYCICERSGLSGIEIRELLDSESSISPSFPFLAIGFPRDLLFFSIICCNYLFLSLLALSAASAFSLLMK
jgi:hypothetical protein